MNELYPFIVAVGHVTNVAKAIVQARDQAKLSSLQVELNGAILDLQGKISGIQADYQQLLERNESIKRQLVAYERWDQESARYSLQELAPGIMAYGLKPDHAAGEPKHWLCPTCHSERKKSILQPQGKGSGTFNCPRGHPPILTDEYV
jgi:hypothetical protein